MDLNEYYAYQIFGEYTSVKNIWDSLLNFDLIDLSVRYYHLSQNIIFKFQ